MATRLEDIKFGVNCAVFEAVDEKLRELIPEFENRLWVQDKHLPRIIPALEAFVETVMREAYDLMPESMNVDPAFVARSRLQMEHSRARVAQVIASESAQ